MTRPERVRTGHWLDAPAPVRKARPTRQHRIVVTEVMLGTVSAISPSGVVRYFDYDWAGAWAWAEVTSASDIRWAPERPGWRSVAWARP